MRQFAGFGTPEDTNARYKALLAAGGTGLSVAFDLPTLMGRDPDHRAVARRSGEVRRQRHVARRHGDAVRRHRARRHHDVDDDQLAGGDDLRDVSRRRRAAGRDWAKLSGHDPERHPEGVHRAEGIHLPAAAVDAAHHRHLRVLRARGAALEHDFGQRLPHPRSGRDGAQELAFTLRDGIEYVQWGIDAGLDVDAFAPRMSFFFNAHSDFFEEIAKYRAARGALGAGDARPLRCAGASARGSCASTAQTAGVSLTAQQPYNNVVRTALQALSAVLGGTNSLHTNSLDEALALPTEEAATLALRTQQIIAHESGVTEIVDPLGRFVFRREADERAGRRTREPTSNTIDRMGGMVAAIERGFPQQEIAESAYRFQQAVERSEKIIVGVNDFVQEDETPIETLYIDESGRRHASSRSSRSCSGRETPTRVSGALDALRDAAATGGNLMPPILDAVRAYATVGEMCDALRDVWGEYEEIPVI